MSNQAIRSLLTCVTLCACVLAFSSANAAEEKKKPQALMSEGTYNRLTIIQDLMERKEFVSARKRLDNLLPNVRSHAYEYAVTLQTYSYLFIYLEDWSSAGRYMQQALDSNALPDAVEQSLVYTLAQIYATLEQYSKTIQMLKGWFAKSENEPPAQAYMLMANAYVAMQQFKNALPYATKAIQKAEKPKEAWYRMHLSIYYELRRYRDAANVLQLMVAYWPHKDQYWKQLSSIYLQIEDDKKALGTLAIIYRRGILTSDKDLMNLARLYVLNEEPYQAGLVLEKGMREGKIKKTLRNYRTLAQSWINAREMDKAVEVLGFAGNLSDDGELYLRQAQILTQSAKWGPAITAAQKAIDKGGLKNPGRVYMVLGSAAAEADKLDVARRAFRNARSYSKTRRAANQWLQYIDEQLSVIAQN
ncbi:MAG: tetratricopeptide repeat protein [Gammaproteobacteria bacterium]